MLRCSRLNIFTSNWTNNEVCDINEFFSMGRAGRKQLKEVTLNSRRFCVLSFWPAKKEVFALSLAKRLPQTKKKWMPSWRRPLQTTAPLLFLFFSFLLKKRDRRQKKLIKLCLPPRTTTTTSRWCCRWEAEEELSLIHIWRCRRSYACRSRWSPYH